MANVFDQFDQQPAEQKGNVFDQFDSEQPQQEIEPANLGIVDSASTNKGQAALIEGAALGLGNFKSGVDQLLTELRPNKPFPGVLDLAEITDEQKQEIIEGEQREIAARDARIDELGVLGEVGGIAGETAPSMVLPGGPQGTLLKKVGGGAVADIAASIADPVREGQTREGNLALAAGAGGVFRTAGEGLSAAFRRASNAASGNLKSKEIQQLIESADAEEIQVFFDDISNSSTAKQISSSAEFFSAFGTAPGRKTQGEEALAAAERWLSNYAGDIDDYAELVQTGVKRKLRIFQRTASKKYAKVAELLSEAGEVQTSRFDTAIDAGIKAELAKGARANQSVIGLLQRYKDSSRGDFNSMIEFRSDFSNDLSSLYRGESPPAKSSRDVLSRVKEALNNDMGDFARNNGAFQEWRDADAFYANNVVKFKESKLKNFLNERSAANFDEQSAWNYLMQQSTNPKRAQRIWRGLDSRGRSAVRAGMLKEALDAATIDGKPFSPARYASFIEKRMDVADQFFRGRAGEEIKGLVKVMRHIERAGQFAENPPTGQRLLLPALFGGSMVEPTVGVVGAGSALGVRTLFQSEAGRNLLLAANSATPGSEAFDAIVENLAKVVARSSNQTD